MAKSTFQVPESAADRLAARAFARPRTDANQPASLLRGRDDRPGILLLGNYRPTLTLVRALSGLGYRVIVGSGGGEGCSEHSRHAAEYWNAPDVSDLPAFTAEVSAFLKQRPDIVAVVPVEEKMVHALVRQPLDLPPHCIFAGVASDIVALCQDKLKLLKLSDSLGVPTAPYCLVGNLAALHEAAAELGPCIVIRPLIPGSRLNGQKAVVTQAGDLAGHFPHWPDGHATLLVQSHVEGRRQNVYFAASNGRLLRLAQADILRTDTIDGTGLAVEIEIVAVRSDLSQYVERMVAAMNYTGVGCAQFIADPVRGPANFLEINPRIAGNFTIPEALGLEFSRLVLDLASGRADGESLRTGRAGVKFAWSYGDIRGLATALRKREIGVLSAVRWLVRLVKTALLADHHMTWRWSDPMPTIVLFCRSLYRRPPAP